MGTVGIGNVNTSTKPAMVRPAICRKPLKTPPVTPKAKLTSFVVLMMFFGTSTMAKVTLENPEPSFVEMVCP